MKKPLIYTITILLIIITVITSCFSITAMAIKENYDFGRNSSSHNKTIDSAELLEMILNEKLTKEEHEYLSSQGEIKITYDSGISSSLIATEYKDGTLTVSAYEYIYKAENGSKVVWTPKYVTLGTDKKPTTKDKDRYFAVFSGVVEDDSAYLDVDYNFEVTVSKDDINSILNKAYTDAPLLEKEIERKNKEYEEAKAKYDSDLLSYENYITALSEYQTAILLYRNYISKKKIYDDALLEYNTYIKELEAYNKAVEDNANFDNAMAEYNAAYAKYREYLQQCEEYNGKLEVYNEYLSVLDFIKGQLATIEATKTSVTSMHRDVYSAIMGNLVTQVLENKDLITSNLVGINPKIVDDAGMTTERLRQLMTEYFALTKESDKYIYYTVNYEAFRDNFTLLLQCLDTLYRNRRVRAALIKEEKDVKYIILVSQLFYIAKALNTKEIKSYNGDYTYDETFTIEKKTPKQILENEGYFTAPKDPIPLKTGYPAFMEEPKVPQVVEEPKRPEHVKIPAKPEHREHPGEAPAPVPKPIEPEVKIHPGEPPKLYTPPIESVNLIQAYHDGKLTERPLFEEDKTVEITNTVKKKIFNVKTATVIFHNTDGQVLNRIVVDTGSIADFEGTLPTKEEDASATYKFDGWVNHSGDRVDLTNVKGDLFLYPHFETITKYYNITFTVNGADKTISLPYGATPDYGTTPKKSDDSYYLYTFTGWDREITPVISHASYVAQFSKSFIIPLSGGKGAEISYTEDDIIADCTGTFGNDFPIGEILKRAYVEQLGIVLKTSFFNINISYSTVKKMEETTPNITLSLKSIQGGTHGFKYSVTIKDNLGNTVSEPYKLGIEAPFTLDENSNLQLSFTDNDGSVNFVPFNLYEGKLTFTLQSNTLYSIVEYYHINVVPSDIVEIEVSHTVAHSDTEIDIKLTVPKGVKVEKIYLIDKDGNEFTVTNNRFQMPKSDVTVGVVASYIKYKVVFMNGDNVIATYYHKYGDTVTPPANPMKVSQGRYGYTFIGWSHEIQPVTSDAVYEAEFETKLLPKPEEPEGLQINPLILRVLILGFTGVVGILGMTVGVSTFYIVKAVKKRKLTKPHEKSIK